MELWTSKKQLEAGNVDLQLMGWCFYKHGILPSEYRKLNYTDKMLMLSAINYYEKQKEKAMKRR